MPAIRIRDLSRGTLDRLKARARRNARSLQVELKRVLEDAARTDWPATRALAAKVRKQLATRTHSDSAGLIASERLALSGPPWTQTSEERTPMPRAKKTGAPVTLFAAIETTQHDVLRGIALQQRRSIADVVREAINQYIAKRPDKKPRRRMGTDPRIN